MCNGDRRRESSIAQCSHASRWRECGFGHPTFGYARILSHSLSSNNTYDMSPAIYSPTQQLLCECIPTITSTAQYELATSALYVMSPPRRMQPKAKLASDNAYYIKLQ